MLKKLLRYDLKATFKYWWIAALASLGISVFGGVCISTLENGHAPDIIDFGASVGIFITIMGLSAFMLTSTILIFIRFYKNFFTDEGYLTFTLPVRHSQLINSKLIMSELTNFATAFVFYIDIIIMLCVGLGTEFIMDDIPYLFELLFEAFDLLYIFVYAVEFILFLVLTSATSTLFMFCCITFASIITKKAKVLTAIGIYYVATSIVSAVVQFLFLFCIGDLVEWYIYLPSDMFAPTIAIIAFLIITFIGLIGLILYLLMYWLLDRKLNLA